MATKLSRRSFPSGLCAIAMKARCFRQCQSGQRVDRAVPCGAKGHRSGKNFQPIGQSAIQKRGMNRRAAFHQQSRNLPLRQLGQQCHEVRPATRVARDLHDVDTGGAEIVATFCSRREHDCGRLLCRRYKFPLLAETQPRVEHNAGRRVAFQSRQAAAQFRIVGKRGVYSDQDCIVPRAQQMTVTARFFARDPFAVARNGRGLTVRDSVRSSGSRMAATHSCV